MTIYAMFGSTAARGELYGQAQMLAGDRVARVSLPDEVKWQALGECHGLGIDAYTDDPREQRRIAPILADYTRRYGALLLPRVITHAQGLARGGQVVFVKHVQNGREMQHWVAAGATPVHVTSSAAHHVNEAERTDIMSITLLGLDALQCGAGDAAEARESALWLLKMAGVRV